MSATMVAVDNPLRKRMFLDKIDTYAKARIAVKNDEQATANSKLTNDHEAAAHAASTYKKDQRAFRQNFNPDNEYRPRDHHSRDSEDSNYSGHSSSRSQPKSRGEYKGKNHDGRPSRDQSQAQNLEDKTPELNIDPEMILPVSDVGDFILQRHAGPRTGSATTVTRLGTLLQPAGTQRGHKHSTKLQARILWRAHLELYKLTTNWIALVWNLNLNMSQHLTQNMSSLHTRVQLQISRSPCSGIQ